VSSSSDIENNEILGFASGLGWGAGALLEGSVGFWTGLGAFADSADCGCIGLFFFPRATDRGKNLGFAG
jgi:hypothetical protein